MNTTLYDIEIREKNKNKNIIIANKIILISKYLFCFFVLSTKLTYSSSKFVLMFILYLQKILDIFMMQYNYQSKYLVIIDGNVYVYKYEKTKFDQPFLF